MRLAPVFRQYADAQRTHIVPIRIRGGLEPVEFDRSQQCPAFSALVHLYHRRLHLQKGFFVE